VGSGSAKWLRSATFGGTTDRPTDTAGFPLEAIIGFTFTRYVTNRFSTKQAAEGAMKDGQWFEAPVLSETPRQYETLDELRKAESNRYEQLKNEPRRKIILSGWKSRWGIVAELVNVGHEWEVKDSRFVDAEDDYDTRREDWAATFAPVKHEPSSKK
jgi:hypothetical protein